jgi:DNA invertase Pin-like site-specific DNA recombinase
MILAHAANPDGSNFRKGQRELREVAGRMGCEIVRVYRDHGISSTKGRDKRPEFDRLIRDAAQRKFDMVMAWSVDRLGRSLQDLVSFLSELHANSEMINNGFSWLSNPNAKAKFKVMYLEWKRLTNEENELTITPTRSRSLTR